MKSKKISKIILITIAFIESVFTSVNLVMAATTKDDMKTQLHKAGSPWGGAPSPETSLAGIVGTVISVVLGLLGIIFLVLIIYAGFLWMTASGDEEKVTKAKDTLSRAAIGLVIIVAAGAINWWVLSKLVQPILMGE